MTEELLAHLDAGGQITSGAQWIYRIDHDSYFLCCNDEGCCDTWMDTEETKHYIETGQQEWKMLTFG